MNLSYHITTKEEPNRLPEIGKFKVIREDWCINCGLCIKECIFDVHAREGGDPRVMGEPKSHLCKNCFRCIQACPVSALRLVINPEFEKLGDDYWVGDSILWTWFQAETGKIPVRGAGYRGPFSGPGFDSMWTDMSEIVRPTRDGIHGREYIHTAIDIGRKANHLDFDENGEIVTEVPPIINVPIPMLFDTYSFADVGENVQRALLAAAAELNTLAIVPVEDYEKHLYRYDDFIVPRVNLKNLSANPGLIERAKMVEVDYSEKFKQIFKELRELNPRTIISVRLPIEGDFEKNAYELVLAGAEVIHLRAGCKASGDLNGKKIHLKDAIQKVHLVFVKRRIRDEITILASGGIAMAEHVPKSLIQGADGVVLDKVLRIALECRACKECKGGLICPDDLASLDYQWGRQRIVNLVGAWRDQLLEVLGAMGLREVRRLRGEIGRSMNFEDLEKETFGKIFTESVEKMKST